MSDGLAGWQADVLEVKKANWAKAEREAGKGNEAIDEQETNVLVTLGGFCRWVC